MNNQLSLSLQAFPPPDKEKDSLQYLIKRVNAQRGSFRNVTEQSLEDEIRALEAGGDDRDQESATGIIADADNTKTKKEEVAQAKDEILKQTAYAIVHMTILLPEAHEDVQTSPDRKSSRPRVCFSPALKACPCGCPNNHVAIR